VLYRSAHSSSSIQSDSPNEDPIPAPCHCFAPCAVTNYTVPTQCRYADSNHSSTRYTLFHIHSLMTQLRARSFTNTYSLHGSSEWFSAWPDALRRAPSDVIALWSRTSLRPPNILRPTSSRIHVCLIRSERKVWFTQRFRLFSSVLVALDAQNKLSIEFTDVMVDRAYISRDQWWTLAP